MPQWMDWSGVRKENELIERLHRKSVEMPIQPQGKLSLLLSQPHLGFCPGFCDGYPITKCLHKISHPNSIFHFVTSLCPFLLFSFSLGKCVNIFTNLQMFSPLPLPALRKLQTYTQLYSALPITILPLTYTKYEPS